MGSCKYGWTMCGLCGYPFRITSGRRLFCSKKCSLAFRNYADQNPAKSVEARTKISAAHRGNQYCVGRVMSVETRDRIGKALKGKTKGVKRGPLSPEQRQAISKNRMGRFCGPDNPNWRGGTSPRDWKTDRYKQLLREVWSREAGKCKDCGVHGSASTKMYVHHVLSWVEAPLFRYSAQNCVLLCSKCHRKRDAQPASKKTRRRLSAIARHRARDAEGRFT